MESSQSAAAAPRSAKSPLRQFLDQFERECDTTLRVLRAYPEEGRDLQPSEKSKTARDLAWIFVMEQVMAERILDAGFDWSAPAPPPPAPESIAEIADAFDAARRRTAETLRARGDEEVSGTVRFFVGPQTLGDIPRMEFLWFLLHDQIHHRGQLSVYLRMAGGRLPSIYGPTADEPWT